jgi:hypothetical protein
MPLLFIGKIYTDILNEVLDKSSAAAEEVRRREHPRGHGYREQGAVAVPLPSDWGEPFAMELCINSAEWTIDLEWRDAQGQSFVGNLLDAGPNGLSDHGVIDLALLRQQGEGPANAEMAPNDGDHG